MGLSSSQARLLNLTGRMHQIEYKAAKLEAEKLQMANESRRVYNDYQQALEKTKIQIKTMSTDGTIDFIDATYNNLIAAGYKIEFVGNTASSTSAKLLKSITQITNPADIPDGYTAIYTAEDLRNLSNKTGNYILMEDIDLSGVNFYSISNFSGTFNGNGHVIKNLSYSTVGSLDYGLFNYCGSGTTISNLGLENINIAAEECCGGIIGVIYSNEAKIENCYVTGTVTSNYPAGGLVGYNSNTNLTILDCYTDVNVYSNNQRDLGGYIFGYCGPNAIINSSNTYYINNGSDIDNLGHSIFKETTRENIYSMIDKNYKNKNSTEWLTNMLNEGLIILQKPDGKGNFFDTSVATDTNLQEVADESDLRKAEAKYEADMRRIDMKDRKYDYDLAALDNERNAIKNEMETLKTVAKDNVDRTFKLFG